MKVPVADTRDNFDSTDSYNPNIVVNHNLQVVLGMQLADHNNSLINRMQLDLFKTFACFLHLGLI